MSRRIRGRFLLSPSTHASSCNDLKHNQFVDICSRCNEAFLHASEYPKHDNSIKEKDSLNKFAIQSPHHSSYVALRTSARSCPLCQLFLAHAESCDESQKALKASHWLRSIQRKPSLFQIDFWSTEDESDVRMISDLRYQFNDYTGQGICFDFAIAKRPECSPFHDRKIAEHPPLQLARKWLEDCRKHHGFPCAGFGGLELPTRLVDVGDDTCLYKDVLMLGQLSSLQLFHL